MYTIIALGPLLWLAFSAFLAFFLAFLVGLVILVVQEQIVLVFSFRIVYQLRVRVEQAAKILLLSAFVLFSIVIASPAVFAPLGPFFLPMLQAAAGAVVVSQYANIIGSLPLADLCFRQADELKDSVSKAQWIREALKTLREHAADLGLELDTSHVEKHLASRLFDHEDIGSEIQSLLMCLSKGTSMSACLKAIAPTLRDIDMFAPRKGTTERYFEYVEKHYQSFVVILAIASLALKH